MSWSGIFWPRFAGAAAALAIIVGVLGPAPAIAAAGHQAGVAAKPRLPYITHCKHMRKMGNKLFLVWVCNSGTDPARELAEVLKLTDTYVPEMIKLMRRPRLDSGGIAGGGDKRIDIYLVNGTAQSVQRDGSADTLPSTAVAETVSTDRHGARASGYMLLNRLRMKSTGFASDFVHEFFHVLQYRYNVGDCSGGKKWWFTEASATWAESFWVPGTAKDEVYWRYTGDNGRPGFEKHPEMSLLNTGANHDYESFIWAYFMQQQKGPAAIARVWKSLPGTEDSCNAMNKKIDAQLSFAKNFRDFAVRNFDSELNRDTGAPEWPQKFGKHYQNLFPHSDFPQALPDEQTFRQFTASGQSQPVKLNLPPLSATYAEIETTPIGDQTSGIELDTGSLSGAANLSVDVIGYESQNPKHNHWIRIRESRVGNGVCLAFDPGYTGNSDLVLVMSNASLTRTTRGTLTIKARGECATSASGKVTHTQHVNEVDSGDSTSLAEDTTVTMNLKFTAKGDDLVSKGSTYTYTASGTFTDDNATCGFSGSGTGFMDGSSAGSSFADLEAYAFDKAQPPALIEEAAGQPLSGCDGGFELDDAAQGCPIVSSEIFFPPPGYVGAYSADSQVIKFNCNDTAGQQPTTDVADLTEMVTGTLTAKGVIPCGLWTSGCMNGTPAKARP